jgi:hypothetical protein
MKPDIQFREECMKAASTPKVRYFELPKPDMASRARVHQSSVAHTLAQKRGSKGGFVAYKRGICNMQAGLQVPY